MQERDAERLAVQLYGLEARAEILPGEHDANFRLVTASGEAFILKVMRPGCPPALVDLQYRALEHAARGAPALTLPRVVMTRDGVPVAEVADPTRAGPPLAGVTSAAAGSRGRRVPPRDDAASRGAGSAASRLVWMLTWVPGTPLAQARPRSLDLLRSLGRWLGAFDRALEDFDHPGARRTLKWDLAAPGWIRKHLDLVASPARRALVERVLDRYDAVVAPALATLPRGIIHNDANDWNVLVGEARADPRRVTSVVDFGDMVRTATVFEPAIAAAYAMLGQPRPLEAAAAVVAGYHEVRPLGEDEIPLLDTLVATRLAVSVVNSALRKRVEPDDPYVTISEGPAWAGLEAWEAQPRRLAHYVFRHACGLPPVPAAAAVCAFLRRRAGTMAPVLDPDPRTVPGTPVDLSVGSLLLGADPRAAETPALTRTIVETLAARGARIGIGGYDEARALYTSSAFGAGDAAGERRTIHLGLDLFAEAGTPVLAALDGIVHAVENRAAPQDYGPVVVLRHETDEGQPFYTLYGHLDETALALEPGAAVAAGSRLGSLGSPPLNGDWPPHLHLQVIVDLLDLGTAFPGVAPAGQRAVWTSLSPDPNLVAGLSADRLPPRHPTRDETWAARRRLTSPALRLSYREPLEIVRGWRQYLYDDTGRPYLDFFNNVPLVGHSHPRVVDAVRAQAGLLCTNTRYLHDTFTRYAERLTSRLPAPLRICFFLNSASEANELALRLARARTGCDAVIVLEHAYHGHTTTLVDVSPYKFDGPGGAGRKPWVHVAPVPDDYRGRYRRSDPDAGRQYAAEVAAIVDALAGRGERPTYLAESLPSVAGQIVFPPGYLPAVYARVRAAGGVCIADEVQVGFGRLGTHMWGFELHDAVPDIVVLGKPIGNGFPLAAVVTTPEAAAAFDTGMEFFSTFGGNPVALAAGLAVLDVLEEEGLQANARRVGDRLLAGLRALMDRHPVVGDVRGSGLFLGVELVRDRTTLEPAAFEARYLVERLREEGILTGTDGPFENVVKIRPPLVVGEADADRFLETLDRVLGEDALRVPS